jgi:predicted ATPase
MTAHTHPHINAEASMTNTIVGEHYQLQNELGAGGMGTVYLGLDTRTQQTIAIKELKSDIVQPEMIERFRREGEALRELNHPNIVKMLDMFEHDGKHYLVMEYVAGGDLSELLKQGEMPLEQILTLSIDLADALTRAHKLDIIHRDLKPANVLIGDDGVLRLTDFGVAHVGSKERVTETDAIIGTIDYLPPEAFDGSIFDARGDIWAFGVMLFEMLVGDRPFKGASLFEVIQAISTQAIPDLETLNPDAPIALIDLIYRMLERDPQARIRSVRQVGLELEDLLQGRDKAVPTKRFDTDIPDFALRPRHNLPAQTTPFVGREHELVELDNLLQDPSIRLITILAQGGMGKTRLSLEMAQRAVDANLYADGVYFVELAPLSSANNIPNAIGDAAGYQFLGEGTPEEQLLTILRQRNILLVMDNYEHLPEGFALVSDILKSAPNVHIIATSRQRLSQTGETLFHLSGMDFPEWETPEEAQEYAAVKLFINSAKRVRPDFELRDDNLDVVARICKLVEGMPLGIVLAASWLSVLSISEISDEIQGSLDFLETDETELPERQRSIRAVIDYSWKQMTETEQRVFMKLSVFRGGFTREAAQEVAGANLRILMSLINKSLIRRDSDTGRYEIHELLRQYAEEHLQQSDEFDTISEQHTQYFADFMANRAPDIKGRRQIESLNEIEADFDNIREAWLYAIHHANYHALDNMMETLAIFCDMRSLFQVGEDLFQNALDQLSPLNSDAIHPVFNHLRARYIQVWNLWENTPVPNTILQMLDDCLKVAEDQADMLIIVLSYLQKGEHTIWIEDFERSISLFEYAHQIAQDMGDPYYQGRALRGMDHSYLWLEGSSSLRSIEMGRQHREFTRQLSDKNGLAHALFIQVLRSDGSGQDPIEDRKQYLYEAISIWQTTKDMKGIAKSKISLGKLELGIGNLISAKVHLIAGLDALSKLNAPLIGANAHGLASIVYTISGDYDSAYGLAQKANSRSKKPQSYATASVVFHSIAVSDFERARKYMHILIDINKDFSHNFTFWFQSMLLSVFLLHQNNDNVRAIERLALTLHHPSRTDMWQEDWQLLTKLRIDIKVELGEEAYSAAWERGKSLDLETVVQELLQEFGGNE